MKAAIKIQQESADNKFKNLHGKMVIKAPQEKKKIDLKKIHNVRENITTGQINFEKINV